MHVVVYLLEMTGASPTPRSFRLLAASCSFEALLKMIMIQRNLRSVSSVDHEADP